MARPANTIRRYARLGAAIRLQQLEAERREINRTFPGLHWSKAADGAPLPDTPKVGRRKFTAAQRQEISERMKKTWAERRRKAGKSKG